MQYFTVVELLLSFLVDYVFVHGGKFAGAMKSIASLLMDKLKILFRHLENTLTVFLLIVLSKIEVRDADDVLEDFHQGRDKLPAKDCYIDVM
jgi:hypothetical protein